MPKKAYEHIRTARIEAGLTQEAAAERLFLTVKMVSNLENGKSMLDAATIGRMATVYNKPNLCQLCCNSIAAEMGIPCIPEDSKPLPVAVIQLVNRIRRFADKNRGNQLLDIAEDGIIDETERPLYDEIVNELLELIKAAQELHLSAN